VGKIVAGKRAGNDAPSCHCEARLPFVARPFRVVHEAKASRYISKHPYYFPAQSAEQYQNDKL